MKKTIGFVLGKFYPPHLGHHYLIDFAYRYVDTLIVVVEAMPKETIDADTRAQWLKSLFPNAHVLVLRDFNPQAPEDVTAENSEKQHTIFWQQWKESLKRLLTDLPHDQRQPNFVFASETYGVPLAECLSAQFIPVDPLRENFPISGTKLRDNLLAHWPYLIPPAQKYFQQRICICGPESTGKSTLTTWLTSALNTHFKTDAHHSVAIQTQEYARTYIEFTKKELQLEDLALIAQGQWLAETRAQGYIPPYHIIDTGVIATKIWQEFLFPQQENTEINSLFQQTDYDLYLLCAPDIPWVQDGARYIPEHSDAFFERMKSIVEEQKQGRVIVIEGNYKKRKERALNILLERIVNASSILEAFLF